MSLIEKKQDYLDARILHVVREVACVLSSATQPELAIKLTLELLSSTYAAKRSLVAVRQSGDQMATQAFGLTAEEQKSCLLLEDGLVARVFATGKSVVLPKTKSTLVFPQLGEVQPINCAKEQTFFAVPIFAGGGLSGVLLVEMEHDRYRDFKSTLELYEVVASFMGQTVTIAEMESRYQPCRSTDSIAAVKPELKQELLKCPNLIGNSSPMQRIYQQISRVASSNATVMIRGESGTGKELIAHAIHHNSLRKDGPFIRVNCAALPETLVESELFGHEKGAFTGAQALKKGRFELAEGGTLFLDEIGELNSATSVKLLRVLQEREFERVGGVRTLKANVRLIVATNKDLEKAISAGTFREDLFYRLNVFAIVLPPLRDRKSDVLLLANYFLEHFNRSHGKNVEGMSRDALDALMSYQWPGNVRELSNVIERAILICDGRVIQECHLPRFFQNCEASDTTVLNLSFKRSVECYEKKLIETTLKTTCGNRARAAKLLRTTERVVSYKARKYGIDCSNLN